MLKLGCEKQKSDPEADIAEKIQMSYNNETHMSGSRLAEMSLSELNAA